MKAHDTVPVIYPKSRPVHLLNMHRTNIKMTAAATEKGRFTFMEKYFFPGGTGTTTPNNCPRSSSKCTLAAQEISHRDTRKSNKAKGNDKYNLTLEIMLREHGLSDDRQRSLMNSTSSGFQNRFYGSRHVMEKLQLLHSIHNGHGYVTYKALNFNRAGNLLCSNSSPIESPTVKVWDWGLNRLKFTYEAGHTKGAEITDLKFIETNGSTSIVSANEIGELLLATIQPSGGEQQTRMLYKHKSSAPCKLALCPQNPFVFISAGWDGDIVICDLRVSPGAIYQKTVMGIKYLAQLYSIAHHPFDPEICVSCDDNYVRVYDKRNLSQTVHDMCPQEFLDGKRGNSSSSSVYNSTGSEILVSYSYEDNYLFNNKVYIPGSFAHRYSRHYFMSVMYQNNAKFVGPNSEYVISSSEFGSICVWDKNTEEIIDIIGDVTNEGHFESHPFIPILASWGNDENIRIWAPIKAVGRRRQTIQSGKYSDFQKSIS